MDKVVASFDDAVSDIEPGAAIGIAGFGVIHGFPVQLIAAVRARELHDLTIVCNSSAATRPTPTRSSGPARPAVSSRRSPPGPAASPAPPRG